MSNIKDVQDVILYESGLGYYTNPARDNCSIRQLLCLRPCTDSFRQTEFKDASVQSEPEERDQATDDCRNELTHLGSAGACGWTASATSLPLVSNF